VKTVREVEMADRTKQVELVQARQAAEKAAISITIAAEADKKAAEDKAEAIKTLADAEAAKDRVEAQGDADAEVLRADAAARRYEVDADGKRALNEAANLLSKEQIEMQVRMALSARMAEPTSGDVIAQAEGLAVWPNLTYSLPGQ